ncbi:MAG: hypothetical protein AB9888_17750 [Bacteroidales bacterium]
MKETKKGKEKKIPAENTEKGKLNAMPPGFPAEEEIRIKANEIYNLRQEYDIEGTPEEDWLHAEELLRAYSEPAMQ